jgi:hypothetical protein
VEDGTINLDVHTGEINLTSQCGLRLLVEVRSPRGLRSAVSEGTRKCGLREGRTARSPGGIGSECGLRGGQGVLISEGTRKCGLQGTRSASLLGSAS